jgi:hypothetical protein
MRNGQNKRMRGRNRNHKGHHSSGGGGGGGGHHHNPLTRVYESNGQEVKIRGTAHHIAEKYLQLARDAQSSGDPVTAENHFQHAEHYFRLIAAAQEQFRQNQPQQPRPDSEMATEESEDEGENFSSFGQEPGFVPVQQQPYMRDNGQRDHQRDGQPYQRDQQQPREQRDREHRPQPQYQPQPQPQPVIADNGSVDRLPSFITGPQPQVNGGQAGFEGGGGGDRFPRRRRRPHGPRPEGMASPAPSSDDFNSGNE